jgi:glycosyltransferase involved in cell wall biosynthesis
MDGLIHRGIRGAGAVVNQTEHQKLRLLANYGREGRVLPSYFPRPTGEKAPGRENVVLWLGNLSPAKQPEIFLDIAESCRGEAGWKFFLAGWGKDTGLAGRVMSRAEGLPNVDAIGAVVFRDTWWWISRAAFLVNTSRPEAEGLPNTFVQAWLSGTPVLSLHHDPNGWIEKHGIGFCAHGDVRALEAECRRLMKERDLIIPLGESARRFAERTFSADSTIDAYLEIFSAR